MFFSIGQAIKEAFFDSLEQAGCLSLDTADAESSGEEEMEVEASVPQALVGYANFKRNNPKSDKFNVLKFHHIEFWCGDATNVSKRFSWGLGMPTVAKSDLSTGNSTYASYVLQSNDLVFVFTAPYSKSVRGSDSRAPIKSFKSEDAVSFFDKHGVAVRAVGVSVTDAKLAYNVSVKNGAVGVSEPIEVVDEKTGGKVVLSEVQLYGDVVLRFVGSENFHGSFLPLYERVDSSAVMSFGLERLDHAVGNVHRLLEAVQYISKFTGFHEFAEFTSEDVGTIDSGLNSMVLANNDELVLLPINEPTFGTKRKSQIQTYLEHNEGPGLQHLALITRDIFLTLREMRMRSDMGGFEFMPRPSAKYYAALPSRIGNVLSEKQVKDCEELGILVDKDDQGVLLQIFTKPIGDR